MLTHTGALGAAAWPSLIAGIAFLVLEMAILVIMGRAQGRPPRMTGAIIFGQDALPPPATFDAGVVAAAMAAHPRLWIVYAVIFGIAAERLWPALAASAAFGLLRYPINFYGFTALFPWFDMARGAGAIVLALAYKISCWRGDVRCSRRLCWRSVPSSTIEKAANVADAQGAIAARGVRRDRTDAAATAQPAASHLASCGRQRSPGLSEARLR